MGAAYPTRFPGRLSVGQVVYYHFESKPERGERVGVIDTVLGPDDPRSSCTYLLRTGKGALIEFGWGLVRPAPANTPAPTAPRRAQTALDTIGLYCGFLPSV